jgi:hypothetical protein
VNVSTFRTLGDGRRRNILTLEDVWRLDRVDSSRVIEIEFVDDEPLEGWVRYVAGTRPLRPVNEIRFSGWLGLLQAIVTLTGKDLPDRLRA